MPIRPEESNKGTFGKVLNFSGSKNYIGAAYLSTVAVLKVGGGYVALASDKNIINSVSTLLPEAVYLNRRDGIKNIKQHSVILVGCGLGINLRLFKNILKHLENISMPVVIDADGLNCLSLCKNIKTPQNLIITPHPLEAARLLDCTLEDVLGNLQDSARKLSTIYNCVTVLKTHRTIICDENNLVINEHGNSALAKAGSGDILAGIISGLLAQKMNLFEAAKLGVFLHSRAGEIASENLTEYSVLASETIKYLPLAIKEII